jgi:hypothetical protein
MRFEYSMTLGLGLPTLKEKRSRRGSGGPASWALVKQRWVKLVYLVTGHVRKELMVVG